MVVIPVIKSLMKISLRERTCANYSGGIGSRNTGLNWTKYFIPVPPKDLIGLVADLFDSIPCPARLSF
jgi:hypothetical protein